MIASIPSQHSGSETRLIHPLRLGSLTLQNNLILAPLCGCSSLPTRVLAKENGAALTFPEMAKGEAVIRNTNKTLELLQYEESERPLGMQICGGDPDIMAESARRITDLGPDLIDINMGCPVKKIVNSEAGCALLKDPSKAEAVIAAVVKATSLPVTVKMRAGWDEESVNHVELARAVENAGAVALTLHPRTRSQFFHGTAQWDWIADVKQALRIPVIGNGDVKTPADALAMFQQTGCDGIMIGRAALGHPWIFQEIIDYVQEGNEPQPIGMPQIVETLLRHFELMMRVEGSRDGMKDMRRHASWYIKGWRGAAKVRQMLNTLCTPDDFYHLVDHIKTHIPDNEPQGQVA